VPQPQRQPIVLMATDGNLQKTIHLMFISNLNDNIPT
jgi:hypothetical protein